MQFIHVLQDYKTMRTMLFSTLSASYNRHRISC